MVLPYAHISDAKELYVGTTQEIRIYADADGDGVADSNRTFFKDFPNTLHRFDWTFGLTFAADGSLYFALSTDSYNPEPAADPQAWRGSLLHISADAQKVERIATGLRFTDGVAINPLGDLFFCDNHGGDNPTEELNFVQPSHFYGHNPNKFGKPPVTTPPLVALQNGVAPTGLCFNRADNDFGGTAGDLFVACWGPDWVFERGSIVRVRLFKQPDGSYRAQELPFAHEVPKASAVAFSTQGDLYATLFGKETGGHQPYKEPVGAIYRFIAADWVPLGAPIKSKFPIVKGDVKSGEKLFSERGCAACHAMNAEKETLGPDLGGIGEILTQDEVLAAIRKPSESIKSGHETVQISKKDGAILLGRLASTSVEELTLIIAGNQQLHIRRSEIADTKTLPTSLMPEGLLNGLSDVQTGDLLAYLGVRDRSPGLLKGSLQKIESGLRYFFPKVSLKAKLAFIALVVIAIMAAIRRKRRHSP